MQDYWAIAQNPRICEEVLGPKTWKSWWPKILYLRWPKIKRLRRPKFYWLALENCLRVKMKVGGFKIDFFWKTPPRKLLLKICWLENRLENTTSIISKIIVINPRHPEIKHKLLPIIPINQISFFIFHIFHSVHTHSDHSDTLRPCPFPPPTSTLRW